MTVLYFCIINVFWLQNLCGASGDAGFAPQANLVTRDIRQTAPDSQTITINKMCGFREEYALKCQPLSNSQWLTCGHYLLLICLVSRKLCQIATLLIYKRKCVVSGRNLP